MAEERNLENFPKLENGVLKFDAKCFIIPNALNHINSWYAGSTRDEFNEFGNKVLQLNGIDKQLDPNEDWIVQLWFHNDFSENIRDHGMPFLNENGDREFIQPHIEYWPLQIFEGKKEGDTFEVKAPATIYRPKSEDGSRNSIDVTLEITLTLDQLNYRYRRYGRFEEAIDTLLANSKGRAEAAEETVTAFRFIGKTKDNEKVIMEIPLASIKEPFKSEDIFKALEKARKDGANKAALEKIASEFSDSVKSE